MKKIIASIAILVAIIFGWALVADAHVASADPSCNGLHVTVFIYPADVHVKVLIDGVTARDANGGGEWNYQWTSSVDHAWSVVVDSPDGAGGTEWDHSFGGTWKACVENTTTTAATTTTTVPPTTTTQQVEETTTSPSTTLPASTTTVLETTTTSTPPTSTVPPSTIAVTTTVPGILVPPAASPPAPPAAQTPPSPDLPATGAASMWIVWMAGIVLLLGFALCFAARINKAAKELKASEVSSN